MRKRGQQRVARAGYIDSLARFLGRACGQVCVVDDPLRSFSVEPPLPRSCGVRRRTSSTAAARGCVYATNGGFFDMGTGDCLGSVVSDGTTIQVPSGCGLVVVEGSSERCVVG